MYVILKKKKKNKGDGVQFKTKREVNVISTNIIREVNAIFS